jgi:oligoribonuclease
MKYVSIDIETTGLNPETCQVIEFAAVIEDTNQPDVPVEGLPNFNCLVYHDQIKGEHYAIHQNANKILASVYEGNTLSNEEVSLAFRSFLQKNFFPKEAGLPIKFFAAGKNFGAFDLQFLKRLPNWNDWLKPASRILDPTMLFFNPESDEQLPSLSDCKYRAGLDPEVKHDALEDARDVIRVIRKHYEKKAIPA